MRRPLSAVIAAAFGVIGLVGLKIPHGDVRSADVAAPGQVDPTAGGQATPPSPGVTSGPAPSPSPDPAPGPSTAGPPSRTVTGSREAAADYGYVQVQITVAGAELTDITLLEVTDSPKKQVRDAPAILVEEALAAQSADIDNVSGATYTSEAFKQSLSSALDDA